MPSEHPPASPRIRSFLAIEIEEDARRSVEHLLAELRATVGGVAWSRPNALHVTLKFLGAVEPERLERLTPRLARSTADQAPFPLTLRGVGAFPTVARPRVIWVGVEAPQLQGLAIAVERACADEGFPPEERGFHPHLTLGRVRSAAQRWRGGGTRSTSARDEAMPISTLLEREQRRSFGGSPVREIILFRSDLGAGGARHTVLARCELGGAVSTRR